MQTWTGDHAVTKYCLETCQTCINKDVFILLVVFIPLILSFVPEYAPYVEQGFNALQNIPEPYWYVVGSVVIDTLGMRAMVRYLLELFSAKFRGK